MKIVNKDGRIQTVKRMRVGDLSYGDEFKMSEPDDKLFKLRWLATNMQNADTVLCVCLSPGCAGNAEWIGKDLRVSV